MPQPSEQVRARDELRRAFVEGAKWWEHCKTGFIMWPPRLLRRAETEAKRRYGEPEGKESLNEKM